MIKLTSVKKNFGHVEVLKDISIEINEGEIYGLIGHSGAGKSTLLRCINGLESYDDGSVNVMGKEIKNLNKNDLEAILQQEESFSNLKNDKEEVLNIFGLFIRDILINKEIENEEFIINSDKLEDIKELTKEMSFKKLNNMIKTIEEARRNIKSNVSWGMTLRVMLMGFMEG